MTRVLIVDDERSIRLTLSEFLREDGHEVVAVENVEEALRRLEQQTFDIIITDIILPRINGMDFLRRIHGQDEDIEFIVISGEPTVNTAAEAVRAGAFDYLPKPVRSDDIKRVVANAAKVKALNDEKKRLEDENRKYRLHLEELVRIRTERLLKTNRELEREINRRKKAEEAHRNSLELISLVTDGIPAHIAYISADQKFLYVNKSYAEWYGFTKEDLIGKKISDVYSDGYYQQVITPIQMVLGGKPASVEYRLNNSVGEERIFQETYVPHFDEEQRVKAFFKLGQDITEHKRIEMELFKAHKLDSIGKMAGGIANEFNNILTVIVGYIAVTKMLAQPGDRIYESLVNTENAAMKAKDLVQQLLTFSNVGMPNKKETSVEDLLKKAVAITLAGSNLESKFFFNASISRINIDPGQINHVFNNLLVYMRQLTPANGMIRIASDQVDINANNPYLLTKGNYIKLTLALPSARRPRQDLREIFDPDIGSHADGMGFELTNAYNIIRNHNGHITAEPFGESGFRFVIFLPLAQAAESDESDIIPLEPVGEGRILVMDDEKQVREVMGNMLQFLGYSVEFVEDGVQAIELYKNRLQSAQPFKLVILDLIIPGSKGGKETIKELRTLDPNVTAIVSSGFYGDDVMENYQQYGFRGVIRKPCKLNDLAKVLREVF